MPAHIKVEMGTYAVCANCGRAIRAERLEALPCAALCIDRQRLERA